MILKELGSMEECVYHTIRIIGDGKLRVWVLRENCPRCGKALMSKPRDSKTGKIKIRAKEYVCPECGHIEDANTYVEKLDANIQYTCPHCQHKGELQIPFKRKKARVYDEIKKKEVYKETLRFKCEKCSKDIDIIKLK